MSRFDYVKYDTTASLVQDHFKTLVQDLESDINGLGFNAMTKATHEQSETHKSLLRSKATALTKLEECYAWVGKAIRDEQILRNGTNEK